MELLDLWSMNPERLVCKVLESARKWKTQLTRFLVGTQTHKKRRCQRMGCTGKINLNIRKLQERGMHKKNMSRTKHLGSRGRTRSQRLKTWWKSICPKDRRAGRLYKHGRYMDIMNRNKRKGSKYCV